jgi:hypothetical protein
MCVAYLETVYNFPVQKLINLSPHADIRILSSDVSELKLIPNNIKPIPL